LEKNTRAQAQSKLWKDVRLHHLTASNFGEICKITDRKNLTAFCNALTTQKKLRTDAILHGQKYEAVAVESFESKFNISTTPCGIFVSTVYPQLAATPDRIIDNESIVEVKCPYIAKNKPINPTTVPYLKFVDKSMVLDENHSYYYQVQGQLLCSNRAMCYFIVYTLKDLIVVRIPRDDIFI
jgi:hypothetical protein